MSDETPKPYTPDSILWWLQRVDEVVKDAVQVEPAPLLHKAAVMANLLQVQVMERQAEALERIAAAMEAKTTYSYDSFPARMPAPIASADLPQAPNEDQIYQCRNCRKLGRAEFFGTPCESAPAGDPIGAHRLDRLVFASEGDESFLVRKPL